MVIIKEKIVLLSGLFYVIFYVSYVICRVVNIFQTIAYSFVDIRHFYFHRIRLKQMIEAVAQTCSVKMVFLEILQNSQGKSCARVSFLIKLQPFNKVAGLRAATLLKRESSTCVFP